MFVPHQAGSFRGFPLVCEPRNLAEFETERQKAAAAAAKMRSFLRVAPERNEDRKKKKADDTCPRRPQSHFECQRAASGAAYQMGGWMERKGGEGERGREEGARRGRSFVPSFGSGEEETEFLRHISLDAEVRTRH